jgi:hypothetical protein
MLVNVGLLLLLAVWPTYDAVQHRKLKNIVHPISDPLEFHI